MNSMPCLKCGNEEFQEVVQLIESKRITTAAHIHLDGSIEESGIRQEIKAPKTENVSFVCLNCSSEYILQRGHLIPVWL